MGNAQQRSVVSTAVNPTIALARSVRMSLLQIGAAGPIAKRFENRRGERDQILSGLATRSGGRSRRSAARTSRSIADARLSAMASMSGAGNHDCPDQRTADNCCAAHEQSRHLLPLLLVPIPAPPAPIAALTALLMDAMALNRASARLLDVLAAERLDRPPDLVASPLRI